ncbi:MAG: gamma-glutamylcyclotransferase, partial [Myxococcota bacterium]
GALFEVDEDTWSLLDKKEGLATGFYARVEVIVLDEQGREWPCTTYEVTKASRTEAPIEPAEGYHESVRAALKELDLPTQQLDAAARGEEPPLLPSGLFTYGTLMRNESRWPALAEAVSGHVFEATCPGCLLDLGEYPALIDGEEEERVHGELVPLASPESWVAAVDAIEGFGGYGEPDSFYRRIVREVESSAGRTHAWTYLYLGPASDATKIAGGHWRNRHL